LLVSQASDLNQTNSCADTEGDLHIVPRQSPQVQAEGHIADVEEMDSVICGLFGADYGINVYDIASDDGRYQFGRELLDEGVTYDATHAAISDSATNRSPNRRSQGKYSNKLWC
jgi:hypothetical protein